MSLTVLRLAGQMPRFLSSAVAPPLPVSAPPVVVKPVAYDQIVLEASQLTPLSVHPNPKPAFYSTEELLLQMRQFQASLQHLNRMTPSPGMFKKEIEQTQFWQLLRAPFGLDNLPLSPQTDEHHIALPIVNNQQLTLQTRYGETDIPGGGRIKIFMIESKGHGKSAGIENQALLVVGHDNQTEFFQINRTISFQKGHSALIHQGNLSHSDSTRYGPRSKEENQFLELARGLHGQLSALLR